MLFCIALSWSDCQYWSLELNFKSLVYAQHGLMIFGVTKACTNGNMQKLSAMLSSYSNKELKLLVPLPPPVALAHLLPLMSAR
jgi:hypothetical protein